MVAIRCPEDITTNLLDEWSVDEAINDLNGRIVITGTSHESLEESLASGDQRGILCALEVIASLHDYLRNAYIVEHVNEKENSMGTKSPPKHASIQVEYYPTIDEFLESIDGTLPFSWVHLGHGDCRESPEPVLSNGEDKGDWRPVSRISTQLERAGGLMFIAILPVCESLEIGDVFEQNSNLVCIHAIDREGIHDATDSLHLMLDWYTSMRKSFEEWMKEKYPEAFSAID